MCVRTSRREVRRGARDAGGGQRGGRAVRARRLHVRLHHGRRDLVLPHECFKLSITSTYWANWLRFNQLYKLTIQSADAYALSRYTYVNGLF